MLCVVIHVAPPSEETRTFLFTLYIWLMLLTVNFINMWRTIKLRTGFDAITYLKCAHSSSIIKKLEFWYKNLWKKKYAERHLTCSDMFLWSFFRIFYLNEEKRSRIAVSPLLPTRPRVPSVMESEASIVLFYAIILN